MNLEDFKQEDFLFFDFFLNKFCLIRFSDKNETEKEIFSP